MSGGRSCSCMERHEPLMQKLNFNRLPRLWRVMQRRCNHSAFNGYHYTRSDWSSVTCLRCSTTWRTKAGYVDLLSDITDDELKMPRDGQTVSDGRDHAFYMHAWGRDPYDANKERKL